MKKKILNKILAALLCVSVFLCSFSVTAFAITPVEVISFLADVIGVFDGISCLRKKSAQFKTEQHARLLIAWSDAIQKHNVSENDFREMFDIVWQADTETFINNYGKDCFDNYFDKLQEYVKISVNVFDGGLDGICKELYHSDNSAYKANDDGSVQVPASRLKQDIKDSTLTFYPTGNIGMVSWKNDVIFGASQFNEKRNNKQFTLFAGGTFFGVSDFYSGYAIPFYYDGETDDYYFANFQLLLTTVTEHANINISRYPATGYDISEPLYSGMLSSGYGTDEYPFWSYSYCAYPYYDSLSYFSYDLSDYVDGKYRSNVRYIDSFGSCGFDFICSDDISKKISSRDFPCTSSQTMNNTLTCPYNFGFYISDKPIRMDGWAKDIDVDKISDNDIITITGDTIYDYKITNSTTGDTSTITEYMNNNYTYITNNNPGGNSGGSGGVGGNVTVGGNVNVSGNVNVGGDVNVKIDPIQFEPIQFDIPPIDINVNVSGGGSGDGGSGSGGGGGGGAIGGAAGAIGGAIDVGGVEVSGTGVEFDSVDVGGVTGVDASGASIGEIHGVDVGDINININGGNLPGTGNSGDTSDGSSDTSEYNGFVDYLDDAVEKTTGIRKFLKDFFDFLPQEIVALILIGLTVVILARIFGR